jgi:transcriptional regulator with XRE-family HTH domain
MEWRHLMPLRIHRSSRSVASSASGDSNDAIPSDFRKLSHQYLMINHQNVRLRPPFLETLILPEQQEATMTINPKTLKALRKKQNLSQEDLAESSKIAKRTIARLENNPLGKKVRNHTVAQLAKVLGVKTEALGKPFSELTPEEQKIPGYQHIKIRISDKVWLNYRYAIIEYGVKFDEIIDAAPWMFVLLAEMSFDKRRKQLKETEDTFEEAMRLLPSHLTHGSFSRIDIEEAADHERESLSCRDVFGTVVLDEAYRKEPFDPYHTNPFIEFIKKLVGDLKSDEINPTEIEVRHPVSNMPQWPISQRWLHELTGGNHLANFAVETVRVSLTDMPQEIKGPDKLTERVNWLVNKIPLEVREREEKQKAEEVKL